MNIARLEQVLGEHGIATDRDTRLGWDVLRLRRINGGTRLVGELFIVSPWQVWLLTVDGMVGVESNDETMVAAFVAERV